MVVARDRGRAGARRTADVAELRGAALGLRPGRGARAPARCCGSGTGCCKAASRLWQIESLYRANAKYQPRLAAALPVLPDRPRPAPDRDRRAQRRGVPAARGGRGTVPARSATGHRVSLIRTAADPARRCSAPSPSPRPCCCWRAFGRRAAAGARRRRWCSIEVLVVLDGRSGGQPARRASTRPGRRSAATTDVVAVAAARRPAGSTASCDAGGAVAWSPPDGRGRGGWPPPPLLVVPPDYARARRPRTFPVVLALATPAGALPDAVGGWTVVRTAATDRRRAATLPARLARTPGSPPSGWPDRSGRPVALAIRSGRAAAAGPAGPRWSPGTARPAFDAGRRDLPAPLAAPLRLPRHEHPIGAVVVVLGDWRCWSPPRWRCSGTGPACSAGTALVVAVVLSVRRPAALQLNRLTEAYPSWRPLAVDHRAVTARDRPPSRAPPAAQMLRVTACAGPGQPARRMPMTSTCPPPTAPAPRDFPVIEALHGYPGTPQQWIRRLDVAGHLDQEIAAGRMAPTVVLFPYQTPQPAARHRVHQPGRRAAGRDVPDRGRAGLRRSPSAGPRRPGSLGPDRLLGRRVLRDQPAAAAPRPSTRRRPACPATPIRASRSATAQREDHQQHRLAADPPAAARRRAVARLGRRRHGARRGSRRIAAAGARAPLR